MSPFPKWSTSSIRLQHGYLLHECTIESGHGHAYCSGIVSDQHGRFSQSLAAKGPSAVAAELDLVVHAHQLVDQEKDDFISVRDRKRW